MLPLHEDSDNPLKDASDHMYEHIKEELKGKMPPLAYRLQKETVDFVVEDIEKRVPFICTKKKLLKILGEHQEALDKLSKGH